MSKLLYALLFGLVVLAMCEEGNEGGNESEEGNEGGEGGEGECADEGEDCASKTPEDCVSPDVHNKCQKSCHLCGECGDSRPDCDFLKERGDCEKADERMCRKACGYCS